MRTVDYFFDDSNLSKASIINKENHFSSPSREEQAKMECEANAYLIGNQVLKEHFTYQEPKNWSSLQRGENGRIQLILPDVERKAKRLIYIFRNRVKQCFLIGKTGGSLNQRMSGYLTKFNKEGNEKRVKHERSKAFLNDVKEHPEHFDVGILHTLDSGEDLDRCEDLFIKYYKENSYSLYNARNGGGGGLSHAEEDPTTYAIPKPEVAPFTPEKYYPYKRDDQGNIRPALSPTSKKTLKRSRDQLEETQGCLYAIKDMKTKKRYIGISAHPFERANQHGYCAEHYNPNHEKYDPTYKSGNLHPLLGKDPEQFGFGVFPIHSAEKIDPKKRNNYTFVQGIDKVEQFAIKTKRSLISEQGFNGNRGGGGPIARKPLAKKLLYDETV